jgi:hypothetical protein
MRESEMGETPSVGNGAQADENPRKNSRLNYKSALPAEPHRCPRSRIFCLASVIR